MNILQMMMGTYGGDEGFYPKTINNSCLFNSVDPDNFTRTPSVNGDDQTWALSLWVKFSCDTSLQNVGLFYTSVGKEAIATLGGALRFYLNNGSQMLTTSRLFRDVASWMHLYFICDITNATQSDRMQIWINGLRETAFSTETYPANTAVATNVHQTSDVHYIGQGPASYDFDGYIAEVHLIDGSVPAVTEFGEFKNSIWVPKTVSGLTYGTNGLYLDFADSANLGNDVSGNNLDWTENSITSANQSEDTPTNNYCTMNPLDTYGSSNVFSNGSLTLTGGLSTDFEGSRATFFIDTEDLDHDWYWEVTIGGSNVTAIDIGIAPASWDLDTELANSHGGISYYYNGWAWYTTGELYCESFTMGDVLGFAFIAGELYCSKNGQWADGDGNNDEASPIVSINDEFSLTLEGLMAPAVSLRQTTHSVTFNFGQNGFTYTPPGDCVALCSSNLPEPTIIDGTEGFYINERIGTGAEATISDVNFDVSAGALAWIKNLDQTDHHKWVDTERGATLELECDNADAEATVAQGVKSFNSAGYVLGTGAAGYNDNTEEFLDMVFRQGAGYGFDIVSFEGTGVARSVSHNLGVEPEMIIVKGRDANSRVWSVYHKYVASDPETDVFWLEQSASITDNNLYWNDTAPTSDVFTVGTQNYVNENGENFVAYLFASIDGFLKVGAYTGNGNAVGPFIYTGFRPAFLLRKNKNDSVNWILETNLRPGEYNVQDSYLLPDTIGAEITGACGTDFLSNGFKLRATNGSINGSADTIVYLAIAEQAFKYANAR